MMRIMSEVHLPCPYFWFDLEFSDLQVENACVLQVAALVTDANLQPMLVGDKGVDLAVRLPAGATVSDWVAEHLQGLLARCASAEAAAADEIEGRLVAYLESVVGPAAKDIKARPLLAGNSIHMDWLLARLHYPELLARLHYRHVDVSTLKMQWTDWLGKASFDKEDTALVQRYLPFDGSHLAGKPHDALYDIHASIAELNFYRQQLFAQP
jgi:oligoribonuclease